MNWPTANTWAANLNVSGVTGWSLPTMNDPNATCYTATYAGGPCGYNNPSTSEMAHMFYTTLGNKAYYNTSGVAQAGYGLTNTGPFSNVQSYYYWSATEYAPDTSYAWLFRTYNGLQSHGNKSNSMYAWAVHAGDVGASAVPVPAAVWLLISGLSGLTLTRVGVARIASRDVTGNAGYSSLPRAVVCVLGIVGMLCAMLETGVASAGSIFLTGHDPDFHASGINTVAINFVTDPTFNPFATGASKKFLFVESNIPVPAAACRLSIPIRRVTS